jgi:hypothetical protein
MANFAVIKDEVVVNIIDAPSKEVAEEATRSTCIEYTNESPARIGWTYDGTQFINPQEESNSDTLA